MKMVCKLIRQGEATANGRVYSKEALERVVALSNQRSLDGSCLVVTDTPLDSRVLLANVVGKVSTALLVNGQIEVEVELLDTQKGGAFKALAPGVFERMFSVAPIMTGTTPNGMDIDPYSLAFTGWALVR
jgi:hypothetical protein